MKQLVYLVLMCLSLVFFLSCNNSGNRGHDDTDTSQKLPRDTMAADKMGDTSLQPLGGHAQAVLAETKPDTVVTGTAIFDTIPGGKVKMILEITVPRLAGKTVAVHIHEHGDCGNNAEMAHGHWNPGNKKHGKWGREEFHAGDIGNVSLDDKGHGRMTMESDLWTIGGANSKNILKRALIIHSGADDFNTQPTGNAGSRIGCGVIQ